METKHSKYTSSEFNDILQTRQSRVTLLLTIFCIITTTGVLYAMFTIEIPQIVKIDTIVFPASKPIYLTAPSMGQIEIIKDIPAHSCEDEIIAFIKNSTNLQNLYRLISIINKNDSNNFDIKIRNIAESQTGENLGEISQYYRKFKEAALNYLSLIDTKNEFAIKRNQLQLEIKNNESLEQINLRIFENLNKKLKLVYNIYKRDSILETKNAITRDELYNTNLKLCEVINDWNQTNISLINSQFNGKKAQNAIYQLDYDYYASIEKAKNECESSYVLLKKVISYWQIKYLIKSPTNGFVEKASSKSSGDYFETGEPVFSFILPNNQYYAESQLPSAAGNNISVGQSVKITLNLFPYQEYGKLEGNVSEISLNTINNNYMVKIKLTNGLKSSTNQLLQFSEIQYGNAEIITNYENLASLVFHRISHFLQYDNKKTKQ
jgi:HlyD family secretion protein